MGKLKHKNESVWARMVGGREGVAGERAERRVEGGKGGKREGSRRLNAVCHGKGRGGEGKKEGT